MSFDQNTWYRIDVQSSEFAGQSLLGDEINKTTGGGATFFQEYSADWGFQKFQFFQINETEYVLRNAEDYNSYLAVGLLRISDNPDQASNPYMTNASRIDESIFWTVTPWGDGTYYMTNRKNGTGLHMYLEGDGGNFLYMTTDTSTTSKLPGQSFSFQAEGAINNSSYSSIASLPTTTPAPISAPTPINTSSKPFDATTNSSSSSSSSSLSVGAAVGIGVGVGLLALVLLIALVWFLLRRRKAHKSASAALASDSAEFGKRSEYQGANGAGMGNVAAGGMGGMAPAPPYQATHEVKYHPGVRPDQYGHYAPVEMGGEGAVENGGVYKGAVGQGGAYGQQNQNQNQAPVFEAPAQTRSAPAPAELGS